MFGKIVSILKTVGAVKRAADDFHAKAQALDDDTDEDGKPQYVNLKDRYVAMKARVLKIVDLTKPICVECQLLFADARDFAKVALEYIDHIASAKAGTEKEAR